MAKLMEKEGCKNTNCEAWLSNCQRAVVYRVGKHMNISMISDRTNIKMCELNLPRRFRDGRVTDTE